MLICYMYIYSVCVYTILNCVYVHMYPKNKKLNYCSTFFRMSSPRLIMDLATEIVSQV